MKWFVTTFDVDIIYNYILQASEDGDGLPLVSSLSPEVETTDFTTDIVS